MSETQRIAERIRNANDLDDLWKITHDELANYGVSGIFYGQLASASETTNSARSHDLPMPRGLLSKTSYSSAFLAAVGNNEIIENDPTVTHCLLNDYVLVWGWNEEWAQQHPWYRERYEIERKFGYHKGCSIPSKFYSDGWVGGTGVAMTEVPDNEFDEHWVSSHKQITDICGFLELGMRNSHVQEFIGLTPREKECLTWLAAGYTPQEIAPKMKIEVKRVAKLVAQCKIKLEARTRDHAVVKALLLGAIEP